MEPEEGWARDWKTVAIWGLGVAIAVLAGIIIGLTASGGLSGQADDPGPSGSTTTVASTTAADSFVAITPSEDTYVDGSEPTQVRNLESTVKVENDPPEVKRALMRFEVSGIPEGQEVSQAVLKLTVARETDAPVLVRLVSGSWNSQTTWANAPEPGETIAVIRPGSAEGSEVEVDVTAAVGGNGIVDLYLTTESDDSAEFSSSESGEKGPVLRVAWNHLQMIAPGTGAVAAGDGDGSTTAPEPTSPVAGEEGGASTTQPKPAHDGEPIELAGEYSLLVGAGDIADCERPGAAITAGIVEEVMREHQEAIVFTAGDNAYERGTPDEFAECFHPTWGVFKDHIRPALGNHDYATDKAGGYFGYFGESAGAPGTGYYSYTAGAWLVVVLNTVCTAAGGCGPGSPQERWLRETLSTSTGQCTLAIWHHPLFSSGGHGGDGDVEPLYRALYESDAELVINGHDHEYERFAPQDPAGNLDLARGIRQFVVGTGGKGLDPFDDPEPNSEVRFDGAYGVLQLKLFESGYEWSFLAEPGSDFTDAGTGACH